MLEDIDNWQLFNMPSNKDGFQRVKFEVYRKNEETYKLGSVSTIDLSSICNEFKSFYAPLFRIYSGRIKWEKKAKLYGDSFKTGKSLIEDHIKSNYIYKFREDGFEWFYLATIDPGFVEKEYLETRESEIQMDLAIIAFRHKQMINSVEFCF